VFFDPTGQFQDTDMATFIRNTDKSGNPTWQVKVRRKGFPSRTKTFPTKAQAQEWARRIEGDMDTAKHPTNNHAERIALADILIRYRDEVAPTHRGAKHEIQRIGQLLREPMSKCALADLTPGIVAHWRDDRLRTVAPGSVLREMCILRGAIKRARNEWGIDLRECPLTRVSKPKDRPHRERRLSAAEEHLLYEGCKKARNPYLRPAIAFALETAMRQGEIVALEWRNVDIARRTARLPMTKNGRSRVVPLSTRAIAILRTLPDDTERVFQGFSTYSVKHAFVRQLG
jgi:integrase